MSVQPCVKNLIVDLFSLFWGNLVIFDTLKCRYIACGIDSIDTFDNFNTLLYVLTVWSSAFNTTGPMKETQLMLAKAPDLYNAVQTQVCRLLMA